MGKCASIIGAENRSFKLHQDHLWYQFVERRAFGYLNLFG
jgi:hypothetical protein